MGFAPLVSGMIAKVVELMIASGHPVMAVSDEWKPKQVVFMDKPLSPAEKMKIAEQFPELEWYSSDPTAHNPADEGFVDRTEDVVVSFPRAGETRRWY